MEITTEKQDGGWIEVRVTGRLDNYWANHFKSAMDELIRSGNHKVRLNLAAVSYVSSAGVGVLVRCHKQLDGIRGKLVVAKSSPSVQEVLEVTRLTQLFHTEAATEQDALALTVAQGQRVRRANIDFETFSQPSATGLTCRLIGDPKPLRASGFGPDDCRKVQFPATTLGLGLGALGHDFGSCKDRFGEFLAAAGAAAYLPTDGTNVPDYLVAAGDSVPELQVCYGLLCEGELGGFARFDADAASGKAPLSSVVQGCLELAKADRIGFVLLAETVGLMGAALRRSPSQRDAVASSPTSKRATDTTLRRFALSEAASSSAFTFPHIRNWLSFTAERSYVHSMALVVGVALRGEPGALNALVRPIGDKLWGHCHAAAFSYQPLSRGAIELRPAVTALFEQQTLQGILHLLADQRPGVGLGESQFVRGACWFNPIGEIVETRS